WYRGTSHAREAARILQRRMDASTGPVQTGRLAPLAAAATSAGRLGGLARARASALRVGRTLVVFLTGGVVALALGVALGDFDGPTAASVAALCVVLTLAAITGWDLLVRWRLLQQVPLVIAA